MILESLLNSKEDRINRVIDHTYDIPMTKYGLVTCLVDSDSFKLYQSSIGAIDDYYFTCERNPDIIIHIEIVRLMNDPVYKHTFRIGIKNGATFVDHGTYENIKTFSDLRNYLIKNNLSDGNLNLNFLNNDN